jgi:feruloyl esterase
MTMRQRFGNPGVWGALIALALLAACGHAGRAEAPPPAELAVVKPAARCEDLARVDLTAIGGAGSRVTSAVEAPVPVNGQPVAFCTVEGTLAPSVGFRVRLPVASWTQRLLHIGCGGLCGNVSAATAPDTSYGCPLVQQGGFVLASTDMGHSGPGDAGGWTKDAQKRIDFAYRGVHVTTEAAKALTAAYYGQRERRAYFVGCSDGGREGLMAAQRYPKDYDGIVVGAPAFLFNIQNSLHHGWLARSNRDNGHVGSGKVVLYPAKVKLLHAAVVKACDALDGAADGLLADPRTCRFDAATLQCAAGASDTSACLTATEVATVKRLYDGPTDPVSGRRLLAGGPQFGSELEWPGVFVPPTDQPATRVNSQLYADGARHLIFDEPNPPTIDQLEFTEAFFARLRVRHALNDATNPDLSAFRAAGGRLILWHGWQDQHISPINTLAYREAVQRTMGEAAMNGFMRTYLAPGVGHCRGGEGPWQVDFVSALVDWVERGRAPDAVLTTRTDAAGAVLAQRPLYPFPEVARHDGSGPLAQATSWRRAPALVSTPVPDWAGADFFQPYAPSAR